MALTKATNRMITGSAANVLDFGAVADGSTDDTSSIQAAINSGATHIVLPYGTYKVDGSLSLSDNTYLQGDLGTVILANFTVEGTGGYPNTVIDTSNATNIVFENIVFDFGATSGLSASDIQRASGSTMNPGIKLDTCTDVAFRNCEFKNFLTNQDTDIGAEDQAKAFRCCTIFDSANIEFSSIKMSRMVEEGLEVLDSSNISVRDSYCYSNFNGTSSFFHFNYCDGVTIQNADITLTGGSVINCYSRNVLIENLRMNETIAADGRGIDLANELNVKTFGSYNITIRNCYLNVSRYGIQGGSYSNSTGSNIITIENNDINVVEDGDNIFHGIRLDTSRNALITNNRIDLADTDNSTKGRCIQLSFIDTVAKEIGDIKIIGNSLKGNCAVGSVVNQDIDCNAITISNNTFTAQDIGSMVAANGASNFFHLDNTTPTNDCSFNKIFLLNNVINNLDGGIFNVLPDDDTNMEIGDVTIDGNMVYAPSGRVAANATSYIRNPKDAGIVNTIRFSNNNLFDPQFIRFDGFYHVQIHNNLLHWDNLITNEVFEIQNCGSGFLTVKNNDFYNHNASYNEVKDLGSNNFDVIHVIGNTNYNNSGVIELDTDFTNSSVPN